MAADRMLKWFRYEHLADDLQATSRQFRELAEWMADNLAEGPERTVAMRKLLEAKDAAVRAKLAPGQ